MKQKDSKLNGSAAHGKGGPSSMDRKKYGRNMAKVINQRGGKRGK
jgi:hypothetical protein